MPLQSGNNVQISECLPGFSHINRYWDKQNELISAKILPGQFYVTKENEAIVTVLGSCISACIRDPQAGIGGMNHFMLPADNSGNGAKLSESARYGNFAMEMLINEILKNGGKKKNLEVKIFGGGKILRNVTDVGERNIEFAITYIKTEGLNLLSSDVGSAHPRKVYYFPDSGRVRIKKLRKLHNETVIEREADYMKDLINKPVKSDIELF
ncbi:MAG: chemoreceptor glutamine deamidase CheD [Thiotrichaceae bacterium]|nr:chemoreceptor glutamine deamidase CheD [Thiotrichaceae bacterium]PCI15100.1 MAG: chemotaxis protein CheD [Thiotrichales bacterium]